MPLLLETLDQRSPEWHSARIGRITASQAAACIGLSPYEGPITVYKAIMGISQKSQNAAMAWGQEYESAARTAYEVASGNMVTETGFWTHPVHDWLGASPDGLIGDDGLLEIKCCKIPDNWPLIPIHHRCQMLIQLACTGRQWCDYYIYSHQQDGTVKTVCKRVKPSGIPGLIRKLEVFHKTYIVPGVEPAKRTRKKKKA